LAFNFTIQSKFFVFAFSIWVIILLIFLFCSYSFYKSFVCFQFSPSIKISHVYFFLFLIFLFLIYFLDFFVKVLLVFNFIYQSKFMLIYSIKVFYSFYFLIPQFPKNITANWKKDLIPSPPPSLKVYVTVRFQRGKRFTPAFLCFSFFQMIIACGKDSRLSFFVCLLN